MISFRDYLTQPPKILCGIARGEDQKLFEELHVDPFQFIVHKDHQDKHRGTIIAPGVMHIKKFGHTEHYLVHREVGKDPMMFTDQDAALQHADQVKKQADKKLVELHDKLSAHYYQTHQKHAIHLATYGTGSSNLNFALMDGETPTQALKLDHALNHQSTPDSMVVYSGISNGHAAKVGANDVVHHPAFLSASLNMNIAAAFSLSQNSNHILKIHVPIGHRGAYIGDLSGANKHEKEFLLPRGLKLRIHRDKEHIVKGNFDKPYRGSIKTARGIDLHIHHATIEP
jgi:hypothetical protein